MSDAGANPMERLRHSLLGEDPLMVESLRPPHIATGPASTPAAVAAAGPRAAGRRGDYELLVDLIHEGCALHYRGGEGSVVAPGDPDLALLLGDQLYALGLDRLAALGDHESIGELADVISLVAQAHAAGDPALADAVWEAGAVAVGWGASEPHAQAKELARAGDPRATRALHASARQARG